MRRDELTGEDAAARVASPDVDAALSNLDAYVVGLTYNGNGSTAAAILGDGGMVAFGDGGRAGAKRVMEFDGAPLAIAPDADGEGFLVGTDAGALLAVSPEGAAKEVFRAPGKWIDRLAVHSGTGRRAAACGKTVFVFDRMGARTHELPDHPSSVSGLAFSPDGAMVAASRYNGATLWGLESGAAKSLEWKGSHTALSWSPNGYFLVTATQENELHCWSLALNRDMRMSGYPTKIRAMSWLPDSSHLAVAGADVATIWSFEGSGPEGKPPLEFGYVFEGVVTSVAAHPTEKSVAAGYSDGTVLIGDIASGDAIIAKPPGGGPVTAMAWSKDGAVLLAGTEDGAFARIAIVGVVTGRRDAAEQAFINQEIQNAAVPDAPLLDDCASANCSAD